MQTEKKIYCLRCRPEHREAYIEYHKNVWSEVEDALKRGGALGYDLYITPDNLLIASITFRIGNDMSTLGDECSRDFVCREWEELMTKYQDRCDFAAPNEWWCEIPRIYSLV